MLNARHILELQQAATDRWHGAGTPEPQLTNPLHGLVLEQHRANFDLWHEEDKARDPVATDAAIATVKRAIDRLNQHRNDLMEQIDRTLLENAPVQREDSPLHSETPGMMIDRLSILELKRYHTAEEVDRVGAEEVHRERNRARLKVLIEQLADLAHCLDELWADVAAGKRRFKLYKQMKMYNDPDLNPVLYRAAERQSQIRGAG